MALTRNLGAQPGFADDSRGLDTGVGRVFPPRGLRQRAGGCVLEENRDLLGRARWGQSITKSTWVPPQSSAPSPGPR